MDVRYRSSLSRDCVVRPVDDLFLIYFRPSGQTHLLPVQSYALLELLDGNGLGIEEIPSALAARYDLELEVGVEAVLEQKLRELEAVGLVEAVT